MDWANSDASESIESMWDTSERFAPSAGQEVVWSATAVLLSCMVPDKEYIADDEGWYIAELRKFLQRGLGRLQPFRI